MKQNDLMLDERQESLQSKCGNEAFVLLAVLTALVGCLIKVFDMDFLAKGEVFISIAYMGVWWKEIRTAYLGASVPDSLHRITRNAMTFTAILMTVGSLLVIPDMIVEDGFKNEFGKILFFTVLTVSAVISSVIYWKQRKNGREDVMQKL